VPLPLKQDKEERRLQLKRLRGMPARSSGFTLLELLVVITIILLFSVVGYPNLVAWTARSRIMGVVESTTSRLQVARQEAIKSNNIVVAQPDFDKDEIVFFVNVDRDTSFEFNPNDAVPYRTADYELGRLRLPTDFDIEFWSATDQRAEGRDAVEGFTPTASPVNAVVFLPDGSVRDPGAIRLGDDRSNFLEVRIGFPATGLPRVQKFHPDPPWGAQAGFFPRGRHGGSGEPMWLWF
jgi:prepilin-type N-terminal cleavage/methylation domain-containing protein